MKLGGESTENTGGTLNFWIKKALSLSISFLGKALLLSVGFYKNIISILHIYIYIISQFKIISRLHPISILF